MKKQEKSQKTLPYIFLETARKFSEKPALIYKKGHCFEYVPYKRLLNLIQNLTFSLEKLGIKESDRVILVSENRPEWIATDLSVGSLGAILVPISKALSIKQLESIVLETDPSLFVISDNQSFTKVSQVIKSFKKNVPIVYLNSTLKETLGASIDSSSYTFIDTLQLIPHHDMNIHTIYEEKIRKLNPKSVVTIVYTIGSNGKFKGVQLTHNNIVSNALDAINVLKINSDDRFLSILPLSHIFERTAGHYVPLFSGATVKYISDPLHLTDVAKDEKPTIIVAVPYIYDKVREKIAAATNNSLLKKILFNLAITYGKSKERNNSFTYKILDHLVCRKIREIFGGNVRFLVSGGAALNPKTAEFFDCLGLPILEGYGLTEASPIVSVNRLNRNRIGTVGMPLPSIEIKLSKEGEILVKGPNIMQGYYKNGTGNRNSLKNGWLRTGDLGEIDKDGFLRVTGRKKEIIVLSTGQNVAPRVIEKQLNKSKYISQSIVIGDGEKHIAALIYPKFDALQEIFKDTDKNKLINDPEAKKFIRKEIDKVLNRFAPFEKVKKFALVNEPLIEKNDLTPKGHWLKRNNVIKKYEKEIIKIYGKKLTGSF